MKPQSPMKKIIPIFLCFILIGSIISMGCTSSSGSGTKVASDTTGYSIHVSSLEEDGWVLSYACSSGTCKTVRGSGTEDIPVTLSEITTQITAQKTNGGTGALFLQIRQHGKLLKSDMISTPYGEVTLTYYGELPKNWGTQNHSLFFQLFCNHVEITVVFLFIPKPAMFFRTRRATRITKHPTNIKRTG